ncbi:MAG: hypothetical protein KIT54_06150 [Phycisphaeraceae bacterium]|nr:hypothetical protein [Phycisphaeraceae bacterium]
MPLLSFDEIRSRAPAFGREWADASGEMGQAQSFWNDPFEASGPRRRNVAIFEKRVEQLGGGRGRIDRFWPGVLLAEHKCRGESLVQTHARLDRAVDPCDREKPFENGRERFGLLFERWEGLVAAVVGRKMRRRSQG